MSRKFVSLFLCVLLIAAAFVVPAAFSSATAEKFDFEEAGYDCSFDYLMEKDGFVYGCDYDFLDNTNGDCSLGNNELRGKSCTYNHFVAYTDIYNIRALGFNAINYWMFHSLEGCVLDKNTGYVIGIQDIYLENFEDMLKICREVGIKILPTIFPHGGPSKNSNIVDRFNMEWNKYMAINWNEDVRDSFIKNAVDPLLDLIEKYQDVVIACGLTIENSTGHVEDIEYGYEQGNGVGTSWDHWIGLVNDLHDAVKRHMPTMRTESEEAGGAEKIHRMSRDTKVDLSGQNYYHSGGSVGSRADFYSDRSGIVGEYNIGENGGDDFSTYYWGQVKKKFIGVAQRNGWLGAFYYSYCSGGQPFNMMSGPSTDYERFYAWTPEFYYLLNDYHYAYTGVTPVIENSVMLANKGTNTCYWIAGRKTTRYTLEHSLDAGQTWEVVAENLTVDEYSCDNGILKYTDDSITEDGTQFCFRVTSFDDEGHSILSKNGNVETLYVPQNMVINGDFECGSKQGWDTGCNVTTDDAFTGQYSMVYDTAAGHADAYGYFQQYIDVLPNTSYKVIYYCKIVLQELLDEDNREPAFFRTQSLKTGNLGVIYNWGTEVEGRDGWKRCECIFSTGADDTQVRFEFDVGAKKNYLAYYDDIQMYENR